MSALDDLVEFWNRETERWIGGDLEVPERLRAWFKSYQGKGQGAVRLDVFPEPYTGKLIGNDAPMIMLGLNPGGAVPRFQAHGGYFVEQLKSMSYHDWASTAPYVGELWESIHGRNTYYRNRFKFAQRLFERSEWQMSNGVFFEMYPYHSSRVTGSMTPPADALREFVLDPLGELNSSFIFAFGKPWFDVPRRLDLKPGRDLNVKWATPSRTARAFPLKSGQELIVMAQNGYAGPPGAADTDALAKELKLR
ncbi:hypothetical protein FB472_2650 [Rhodoglobus vestalii]|uniref:Uncharacterized protein n=1 Tax=Rhodoglobus vestalii TaxID=193384 RepID=A0A8H2K899_9MICO|nr:hypothetical protein [Rhodoglobus vestalii]TQO20990.1 hypothetical protein FB472_2650 [Rhodoglobus vestalii]